MNEADAAARSRAAEEALEKSLAHVVHEYVRQDLADNESTQPDSATDGLHFTAGPFRYNKRIGALLCLGGVAILPVLGSATLIVLIVAAIAVYILDFLNFKKGTVVAILMSLLATWASMFATNVVDLSRSADAMLLIVSVSTLLAVVAGWVILQFHWVQVTFPELVCLLERLVLGLAPIATVPSLFAFIIGGVGSKNAPFVFAVVLCIMHFSFYRRLHSTYLSTLNPKLKRFCFATGEEEASAYTALVCLGPVFSYFAVHNTLDFSADVALHVLNISGLLCLPLLYIVWHVRSTLWFIFKGAKFESVSEAISARTSIPRLAALRFPIAVIAYVGILHCAVYRVVRSRYGYLLSGIAPPFNEIILAFVGYCYTFVGVLMLRLTRPFENPTTRVVCWFGTIILTTIATVLLGIVAGMPQFFLPMSALTVAAFSAFILDPRQANNYMMFLFSSILMLLWWMYKTFSFIRMDLPVLGESASVSTQAVAVSVLWAYILGAVAFCCGITKSPVLLTVCLILQGLKVTWVEHVLYSQREQGTYPFAFIVITTAVGITLAYRLFKNGILSQDVSGAIAALYIGKFGTWLYDVTAWRYTHLEYADSETDQLLFHAIEGTLTFWCLSCAAWLLLVSERSKLQLATIFAYAAVLSACQRNALVRYALDFAFHDEQPGIFRTLGGILLLYGVSVYPIAFHPTNKFAVFTKLAAIPLATGVVLLVIDPALEFMVSNGETDGGDIPLQIPGWARVAALCAVVGATGSRLIPFMRMHRAIRVVFWIVLAGAAALACIGTVIPLVDFRVVGCLVAFFILAGLTIEIAHYSKSESYVLWIVYACAIASMALCYVSLNNVNIAEVTSIDVYIWELHTTSRHGLLALSGVCNLLIAMLLKFRRSAHALLPSAIQLTPNIVQTVGLVTNYSALLAFVILGMLNHSIGDGVNAVYIINAAFLLLLHDDDIIFVDLSKGLFRYLPPFIGAVGPLWFTLMLESFAIARKTLPRRIWHFCSATPLLASQVSLVLLMAFGAKKYGSRRVVIAICCALDCLMLMVHTSSCVQWMAVVNLTAHACRLYGSEFWKQRSGPLL